MFGFINKIKNIFSRQISENEDIKIEKSSENVLLSSNLDENIKYLRSVFDRCNDVAMRSFQINAEEPIDGFLIYIDGMIDEKLTATNVLRSLQLNPAILKGQEINRSNAFNIIKDSFLSTTEVHIVNDMTKVVENILSGQAVLLIEGTPQAIVSSVRQMEDRSVEEPQSEPLVRGPRDGFVESLRTNTTLIRRRLKTSRLKMEIFKVGTLSQTDVAVIYIDGIANDKIVDEVKRRIKRIEIDGVLESSYLEEFIEDDPSSIFPQVNTTERPDRMCACLLEGRVGILVDNTPICLIVPATFLQFLQSPEDYYNRFPYATFTRILRFVTMNIALLLPSAYIAVLTFHQEMLPTPLLISIAGQREGVPFPAFLEAIMMEMVFEFLREAGVRLPRPIGQAVSIVGALVIGQAAVSAGLVTSAMVMVVSLTAIASFTIPTISGSYAVRILRFPMMVLAASFGLFGIMVGLMAILIHVCTLRSFGVPYITPLAPFSSSDFKDSFIRMPWWAMIRRPKFMGLQDSKRQKLGQKPGPSQNKKDDKGGKSGA
ncbi:spore germination protein [Tepidanaerobacter sp. GT38]|uniref:spore germination protein n=1 Tax=Tepidanaerobacter sp. GT38 TaxID=2722793 RepID=UPI001F32DA6E|nr:spore germination protein [Tepidanaerobacter sp. GT38]MCG1011397.1 spore germination protein [Tepidanaerobacter sp. GT38]